MNNLNKNISIIYRNYKKKNHESTILSLRNYCKTNKRQFYLSNDIKMAVKLKLNGVYIPSFVKIPNLNIFTRPKKFLILGSAHNKIELKIKKAQGCSLIFLAPTFEVTKKKNYLGINRFNLLTLNEGISFIVLGGVNQSNLKKIKLLNCIGFSGISWIKKNGLKKLGRF